MKKNLSIILACLFLFALQRGETTVHVIWQIDKNHFYESDWVEEVLSKVHYNEIIDGNYEIIENNSIVIICLHDNTKYREYFAEYDKKQFKYAIVHVGDELYGHPTDCYANAQFVLRNYWHKKFLNQKNVYAFPVGYKREFWKNATKSIKNSKERKYTWSFAGQIVHKPTREAMIIHLKTVPNYFIHETFTWADPNSLSTNDYRELLLNTIFVPCPTGWWNLDSFRIGEALECGCIPIVEKKPFDYFSRLFSGKYPFLAVDTWDKAPALINELLANPIKLEQTRQRCHRWWLSRKKTMKNKVAQLSSASFG